MRKEWKSGPSVKIKAGRSPKYVDMGVLLKQHEMAQ